MPEYQSDNELTQHRGSEIHHAEVVEEKISLSDRFGLWVSFYPVNQSNYLEIAQHWLRCFSDQYGLEVEWSDEIKILCVRWADSRGTRSGRTAYQFAKQWIGQKLLD